jgi:hypothetical protein
MPEDVWGSGVIVPPFLSSALHGGERSASRSDRFTPDRVALDIHWIGGRVSPEIFLDAPRKRKTLLPRKDPGLPDDNALQY